MKTKPAAGIIVLRPNSEARGYELLLLCNARHGEWGVPKGRSDRGDRDVLETARREVYEETRLDDVLVYAGFERTIEYIAWRVRKKTPYTKRVTYLLGMVPRDSEITISSEHREYRWIAVSEIDQYVVHTNLRNVVRDALAYLQELPSSLNMPFC